MRTLLAGVLTLALAATATVGAHLVLPAEFREVVNDASLIVRGRVTDVRVVNAPGAAIDSIATIAVENVLKGNAGGFVYVRVPGGTIGRRKYVMVGAPTFRVGERAVLFLRPGSLDTTYRPIGLTMGVYPVGTDTASRRLIVQPPIVPGRNAPVAGATPRGDRRRQSMAIGEFESLVRLMVATPMNRAVPRGNGR